MIDKKGIDKVIAIIMIAAVILMLVFMYGYSGKYQASISYAYEDSLFDTDEVIKINIQMDEDDWSDLLENAISEEYYKADVTVNGETYGSCGIRAKGNTSLSMVASSGSDRFSFKINFDEYVSGQTCDGLNKLVLNNNYSDATMMKEAVIYDMFNYIGADAPLYNYAEIYVNGEYWGVYLALEAVEEEFMVRTYGTDYGKLYKPDSMDMGGGRGNMKDFDMDSFKDKIGWNEDEASEGGFNLKKILNGNQASDGDTNAPDMGEFDPTKIPNDNQDAGSDTNMPNMDNNPTEMGQMSGGFDPTEMGNMSGGFDPTEVGNMPGRLDPAEMGDMPEGFDSPEMGDMLEGFGPNQTGNTSGETDTNNAGAGRKSDDQGSSNASFGNMDMGGKNSKGGMGGPGGFGSGSSELNYIDDDLDSYSTIWDSDVFSNTTDTDHERVVKALKEICQDDVDLDTLNKYLDVDNMLRYMAVHTFAVNLDSLTGSMAHNYYLYEDDGQLNMLPWDYNLALGGFMSGQASTTINFPIDTPFSSDISEDDRQLFYALLNNDECLEKYHEYLRTLCEDYVQGGVFNETYERVRTQIDELVAADPTAFYTYDEYVPACEMLNKVVNARAESIIGQLNGSIPSTWVGQNQDSSGLIDCSDIDTSVMGSQMGGIKGGFGGDGRGGSATISDFAKFVMTLDDEAISGNEDENGNASENSDSSKMNGSMPNSSEQSNGDAPSNMQGGSMPNDFGQPNGGAPSAAQGGGKPNSSGQSNGGIPEGSDPSQNGANPPDGFDPSQMGGNPPNMTGEAGAAGGRTIGDTIYVKGIGYKTGTGVYKALKAETIEVSSTITQKLFTSSQKRIASKNITFKSGNKKVATVSSTGKITAKKTGTATIYATYKGTKYIAKITVVKKGTLNREVTASDVKTESKDNASASDSDEEGEGSSITTSPTDASETASSTSSNVTNTTDTSKANTTYVSTSKDVSKMTVSELAPYFGLSSDIKLIEDPNTISDYDNNILYSFLTGNYDLDFEFDSYSEASSYARTLSTRISYLSTTYPELMGSYCNGDLKIKLNGSEINSGRYRGYSSNIADSVSNIGKISAQYTIVIPGMGGYQNMVYWMNSMMEQMRRGVEDMDAWMNQYEEESTGPVTLTISIDNATLTDDKLYSQQLEALQKALDISAELHNSGKITSSMSDTDIAEFYYDYLDTLGIEGSGLTSRSSASEYMKHDTIYGCLILKQADCVGHTALYNLFMHIEGVDSVSVCGMFKQSNEGHVLNRLELDGEEYFVDWLNRLPLQSYKSLTRIFSFDSTSLAYARNL